MTERSALEPKDAEEKIVVEFSFASEMAPGEAITQVLPSSSVVLGIDAAPGNMLDGPPLVVGTSVYQRVAGGANGNVYRLRCRATISSGNVLVRAGDLPVREA